MKKAYIFLEAKMMYTVLKNFSTFYSWKYGRKTRGLSHSLSTLITYYILRIYYTLRSLRKRYTILQFRFLFLGHTYIMILDRHLLVMLMPSSWPLISIVGPVLSNPGALAEFPYIIEGYPCCLLQLQRPLAHLRLAFILSHGHNKTTGASGLGTLVS